MLTINRRPWPVRILRETYYFIARPIEKTYWYLFRPYRPGAKTFVFNGNKVLMVKLGYAHKRWVFPGGGIERGETPEEAAVREVYEEAGVPIVKPLLIGERFYTNQYKKVTQYYFVAEIDTTDLVIDGQEIMNAGWFTLDNLPDEVSPRVREEVKLYTTWKYEQRV